MKKIFAIIAVLALLGSFAFSQDTNTDTQTITVTMNEIALLAVTGAAASIGSTTADAPAVTITVTEPPLAGDAPIVTVVHDATYLRYTSLRFAGLTRKVTATLDGLPAGFSISLNADAANSPAKGNVGAGSTVEFVGATLTGDLVESIGAGLARTGTEAEAGHLLTYTAKIDENALGELGEGLADGGFLNFLDTVITVTFTLTDI